MNLFYKRTVSSFSLIVFLFSCSSQPISYHPSRRQSGPLKNLPSAQGQNDGKNYTTETIREAPTTEYSSTNPYGLITGAPAGNSSDSTATSNQNNSLISSSNYLNQLRKVNLSKNSAEVLITRYLNSTELESAAADNSLTQHRPLILWQLGQIYLKNHKSVQAMDYFKSLQSQFPQHPLSASAQTMINLIQASETVEPKVIGAILPLSGKNASIGQHALNSIKIALGLNRPDPKFKIAVYDTQSLPEKAQNGVDKLILENKPIALIGGLSAKEASVVGHRADLLGIPFIALSQKPGITNIGDYVFRNSLTPDMQVDQLLEFAFKKLNARKFAVLFPNDSYGVEFANIYWDQVLARGGQMTAVQTYDPKENDFTGIIQKLVGTYYTEARNEEFKERIEDLKQSKSEKLKKNKDKPAVVKNSREHDIQESILQPIVDFDVLFIPDSGKALGQIMAFMKAGDVNQMTYLGTNIWNTPEIVKRASSAKENVYFVDALDPNDNSIKNTAFYKEYVASYEEEPTLIEMQVYESTKIIRDLILSGITSRESIAQRLRILGRSQGITGELRMSNQRELIRPIHVLSLDNGLIKKVF